jgi:hypothetical protein
MREALVGAATTPTVVIKSGRGDRQQATAEHSMGWAPLHSDDGARDEGGGHGAG